MSDEERKTYKITADYKKSTYQEEHWTNQLKNGKYVMLHVTTLFRWGTFEITLTDEEKEDILKKESIILNDYDSSLEEMWGGCDLCVEIQNENTYSVEEIQEIHCLIYSEDLPNSTECEYDSENGEEFQEDIMESNGWDLDDTIYIIASSCILEEQS